MEKTETLKDGTKVTIKNLTVEDIDRLMSFYLSLPEEDLKYLRVDVTTVSYTHLTLPTTPYV